MNQKNRNFIKQVLDNTFYIKIINKNFLLNAIKNSRTNLTDEQIQIIEKTLLSLKEAPT